ncbi:Heterokaryon incompatibility protein 6, OR allele [Cytospora mali]|uniref:Heterokaryon incompatibility protein 6, OR allele n=1 Tax=Cytospora mali TaxID=578113 RepID=A0A194UR66_CYTMA|nr:Heterokaryon incompatibility protein 6, OR allele [Valsa mali var. pyri (nom. inval.)]
MPRDTHLTFADIFPDPRDLKRQILEILPHIRERKLIESPTFTFLAIRQAPQLDGPGSSSGAASSPVENLDDMRYTPPSDKSPSSAWSTTSSESRSDMDNLGNTLREFTADDWNNPDLQLSLVKTSDKMGFESTRSYIAVSYCWPSEEEASLDRGELGLPVTICKPDGDCRPSKALPHILRRAVKQAGSLGRKYIWIDQECINQDDSDEKEAAIQCMDVVYRSSQSHILCLLDLQITDQEQISLLEALHICNVNGIGNRFYSMTRSMLGMKGTPEMARILAEILNMVAANRWFFRAWIMHERLCAATLRNTELLITCAPDLASSIPGEVCLMGGYQLEDAQEIARHLENNRKDQDGGDSGPHGALQFMAATEYETPGWVHTLRPEILFGEFGDDECQQAAQVLRAAISHFEASYKAIQPAAHRRRLA